MNLGIIYAKGFVLLGNIMVLFYAPSLHVLGIFPLWSLEWVSNRMQFSLVKCKWKVSTWFKGDRKLYFLCI